MIGGMMKQRAKQFSDEIRAAVADCGMTRYRIAQETGIDGAALCRFVQGRVGLSLDNLDKLAKCIDLHVVSKRKTRTRKG